MNPKDERLLEAVENRDLKAVRDCLRNGANPNALQNGDTNDPLVFAALHESSTVFPPSYPGGRVESFYRVEVDIAVLRILLTAGTTPNVRNGDGETPLTVAVDWMNFEAAELLLDHGADVNYEDEDGRTPLIVAARWSCSNPSGVLEQEAMIRLLVGRGANIDAQSRHGETALICAVYGTNDAVVKLLLELGADRTLTDSSDHTALYYAEKIYNPVRQENILALLRG